MEGKSELGEYCSYTAQITGVFSVHVVLEFSFPFSSVWLVG